jgi:hypothetical protein
LHQPLFFLPKLHAVNRLARLTPGSNQSSSCQEFIMSARNGDKSRFNRERKQKIARRKRIHELLARTAKAPKPAETTVRAQPRSVSA